MGDLKGMKTLLVHYEKYQVPITYLHVIQVTTVLR